MRPYQHAEALACGAFRHRYERADGPMKSWRDRSGLSDEACQAVERDHARLIRAAWAERFVLDRLCLDDDAPLSSEVERVRAALERVATIRAQSDKQLYARSLEHLTQLAPMHRSPQPTPSSKTALP